MKLFQVAWGALRSSYSCLLGIAMNALLLLAQGALQVLPPNVINWASPAWYIAILFFLGMLIPVAVVLVIGDVLKGEWMMALVGAMLCFSPLFFLWTIAKALPS